MTGAHRFRAIISTTQVVASPRQPSRCWSMPFATEEPDTLCRNLEFCTEPNGGLEHFFPVRNSPGSLRGERPAPASKRRRLLPRRSELAHSLAAPLHHCQQPTL